MGNFPLPFLEEEKMASVAVVGAGISGLSVAVLLQTSGRYNVTIHADHFSPHTTSDKAGGILMPYALGVAGGDDAYAEKEKRWFKRTYEQFLTLFLSRHAESTGVSLVGGYEAWPQSKEEPWYSDIVMGFRNAPEEEKAIFGLSDCRSVWQYQTFLVDCRLYLPWLLKKFTSCRGQVVQHKISSFREFSSSKYDIVVNCTGLGSASLANDSQLTPVSGQLVSLHAPWLKCFIARESQSDDEDEILIAPRAQDVVVGTTTIANDTSSTVNPQITQRILANACKLVPGLKDAPRLGEWCGLRPCRPRVRLELEQFEGGVTVVHDYAHGGNGVNYSWGCALDVLEMVDHAVARSRL